MATNSDRFIAALSAAPGPVCDDCASAKAEVFPRQQINQIASRLFRTGQIHRAPGQCIYCSGAKKVSAVTGLISAGVPSLPHSEIAAFTVAAAELPGWRGVDQTRSWHWEGNVQCALREHLERTGWMITAFANTGTKEAGIDVVATRGGSTLMVEVKGYPSTTYEHGSRRGLPKPTQPTNQARQWYSHALLSVMRLLEKKPSAHVALCFPDFPTYRKLIAATRTPLRRLGVGVFLVSSQGAVVEHLQVFD